ncbi:MAG: reverse transcriptase family protein, partial [Planctomycetales bacterium]
RQSTIVHLGDGVSSGLQEDQGDAGKLLGQGLPVLRRGENIAQAMGIPLSELRWLCYHRKGAAIVHYRRYDVAKKTGGVRCISAPAPKLARAQQWLLANVLGKLNVQPEAHGFVAGRSILSGAQPHAGRRVVVNMDLKDFFPSITFRRVQGLFRSLGYSGHAATVFALLCTEPPRVPTEFNGKVYYVSLGERALPQGACTSPAITNAICGRLDRRLAGLASARQYTYTRYADDLTFSGDDDSSVGKLLRSVRSIIAEEGFEEQPTKTKVMRNSRRQEVTGLTVNQRPAVSRQEIRKLRAILHNAAKHGLESQNRENRPNFAGHLRGKVAYVCMIDPQRGAPLREALQQVLSRTS